MGTKPTAANVIRSIVKLEHFINGEDIIPAARFYRGKVLLALVSKALTAGRAVCCLVQAGFPGEAFGLSRTLIEIFFAVRYISNRDSEARAKTYAEYFAKAHEEWAKIIKKHYPRRRLETPGFHRKALEVAKNYKSRHQWTDLRGQAKVMALEDDTYEFDSKGQPVRQEFDYEVIYWWASQFVHATVVSLQSHATEPGETFRVRARSEEDRERAIDALFNVLVFLSKIFICAFRGLRQEPPLEILTEIREQISAYAAIRKRRPWPNRRHKVV